MKGSSVPEGGFGVGTVYGCLYAPLTLQSTWPILSPALGSFTLLVIRHPKSIAAIYIAFQAPDLIIRKPPNWYPSL